MSGDMDTVSVEISTGATKNAGWNYFDLDGRVDEARAQGVVRTPDWIMAQWKSQDETLITYGAEQPA